METQQWNVGHFSPPRPSERHLTDAPWAPASLASEGFIQCTDGLAAIADTANRFYAGEPGAFLLLTVDLDAVGCPWRIDEPGRPYPHIYGPLPRSAILAVRPMPRTADGRFTSP